MKKAPLLLLLLMAAAFVFGLFSLFRLRFEAGDNYPEYSSLRADPLGSKALYESLRTLMPGERHFRALDRLRDGRQTTLFFLGAAPDNLSLGSGQLQALETFVRSGGRLVVSLLPAFQPSWRASFPARPGRFPPPPPAGSRTNQPPVQPPALPPGVAPSQNPGVAHREIADTERFGVEFKYQRLEQDAKAGNQPARARRQSDEPLPGELLTHTALYFDNLAPAWRVLYARSNGTNTFPVVVERPLGRGTLVLAADSYPFSNEALRRERHSDLLAWLVGPSQRVIFDETHLGVADDPGIATLARQYRLAGFFLALLVLAGLFVWRNAVSFLPAPEERLPSAHADLVEGRDSASGFIHLLRRHVPPADIMKVCLEQWNAHFTHARKPARARLEAMQKQIDTENALPPHGRNPVRLYREFCRILSKTSGTEPR